MAYAADFIKLSVSASASACVPRRHHFARTSLYSFSSTSPTATGFIVCKRKAFQVNAASSDSSLRHFYAHKNHPKRRRNALRPKLLRILENPNMNVIENLEELEKPEIPEEMQQPEERSTVSDNPVADIRDSQSLVDLAERVFYEKFGNTLSRSDDSNRLETRADDEYSSEVVVDDVDELNDESEGNIYPLSSWDRLMEYLKLREAWSSLSCWFSQLKLDTSMWGVGQRPIFRVSGDKYGGMNVVIDEEELRRRFSLLGSKDEKSSAILAEKFGQAKLLAKDIELGNFQPPRYSTVFKFTDRDDDGSSKPGFKPSILSGIQTVNHQASPMLKMTVFGVALVMFGSAFIWSAWKLIRSASIKDEDKGFTPEVSSRLDPSEFDKRIHEIQKMARQARLIERKGVEGELDVSNPASMKGNDNAHSSMDSSGAFADVKDIDQTALGTSDTSKRDCRKQF